MERGGGNRHWVFFRRFFSECLSPNPDCQVLLLLTRSEQKRKKKNQKTNKTKHQICVAL